MRLSWYEVRARAAVFAADEWRDVGNDVWGELTCIGKNVLRCWQCFPMILLGLDEACLVVPARLT